MVGFASYSMSLSSILNIMSIKVYAAGLRFGSFERAYIMKFKLTLIWNIIVMMNGGVSIILKIGAQHKQPLVPIVSTVSSPFVDYPLG